uniref:ubiquitinyl hydrolase 1 n=1 Tax=Glossina pallidipes TaxID=7398 RepID=A0A1A9ZZN0_GLOPL
MAMCDICSDFQQLLESYEIRINDAKHAILYKNEIETAFGYIQAWPQRQCMCLYRDVKNFERFNLVVQSMIYLAVHHLKHVDKLIEDYKRLTANAQSAPNATNNEKFKDKDENIKKISNDGAKEKQDVREGLAKNIGERKDIKEKLQPIETSTNDESMSASSNSSSSSSSSGSSIQSLSAQHTEETWILPEVEKLFLLVSKIFLLNFPLYIAYKHGTHARLDDISAEEAQHLAIFCDLHDNEIPVYLLRNICLFCNSGGFAAMMLSFEHPDLPVTTAHAITATVSNIKLWLNYGCIVQLFVPLRSRVLQYMCKLSDQNLRTAATRAMADFVWSAVRDPLDASVSFDVEGLALAFKYFTSTTLTMRLAGIAQINAHINIFGEIESVGEVEIVAQKIATWLTENQIIQHLFGPNLHVEVLKQAHIVLNFLAVENQITEEHIKLIWQATQQLKHCSKTIFDILPSLVKNLAPKPAMYLYTLLCRMDPKEHTEQSIYIASALTKLIWSRDKSRSQMSLEDELLVANATATSSDCGSMDGSNSDEGNCDDSSLASARKSPVDIENICSSDTGAPPCKQARRRRHVCDVTEEKKEINEEDINMINTKVDMKMKNHRIVNIIDNSSSEDDLQQDSINIQMHRKKSRKRRKNNSIPLTRLAYHIVEAICDGGEDEASSDDAEDGEGEILNDSDDCSDPGQVPSAVLKHLQGEGPYIRAIAETHISELLSGAENDGSYSSPISNKSEKNMADFDDEDVSPCEEELAQLSQLGESLALEAEKALATLLCFSNDRQLRTKFIEGCLHNLANNKSVIVSLRLLPKLFASFQQFRPSDTHQITMWAERQHKMMYHFFNNIKHYTKRYTDFIANKGNEQQQHQLSTDISLYSHKTQVSVRLHFLSSIFSSMGSPKTFRLSLEQVDALWEWLAHDPECADCYFSWLQSQAKGGDQHALGLEALQHLYLKKLPELRPEEFSMVALGLFQQLCSLARMAIAHYEKQTDSLSTNSSNIVGMYHLWKIALRAHNTEVSLAAIQYINMYYMGQQLRFEREFVSQCMENLVQAANALESNEDENALMCVQRGLMLLNTHLETFRRRYAFHLRRWAIEGQGIGSHSNLKNEGGGPSIRIILQPNGLSEKSVLHMHNCDLIAELKAEISKWWENLQGSSTSGVSAPVLGLLLSEGPLRIITQGQELSSEYDERTLIDAGFKDNQIVYVSLGGRGARRKETNVDHPSMQPPPPKEHLPTVLLLQSNYFEKLFRLMQTLGDMKPQPTNLQLHTKAQLLSRRVWDILAILPTNPMILDAFKGFSNDLARIEQLTTEPEEQMNKRKEIKQKLCELLDPSNLQKFMYSMHIVESLALNSVFQGRGGPSCCGGSNGNILPIEAYTRGTSKAATSAKKNANNGGKNRQISDPSVSGAKEDFRRLNQTNTPEDRKEGVDSDNQKDGSIGNCSNETENREQEELVNDKENNPLKTNKSHHKKLEAIQIFGNSPIAVDVLRRIGDSKWSETFIKCGGLKHLYEIFVSGQLQQSTYPGELLNEWRHDCLASLLRILWLLGFEEIPAEDMHVAISQPKNFMLEMMQVDQCLQRLSSILNDEAYANYLANTSAYQYHHLRTGFWGRAQVVQFAMNIMVSFVHASAEARCLLWAQPEYCNWVQKFILEDPEPAVRREICAGLYRICLGNAQSHQLLLAPLLRKLISFLSVAEKMTSYGHQNPYVLGDDGKEPYGPACRDYFWLLARLVDTLSPDMVKSSLESSSCNEDAIDIEKLCQSVAQSILTRDFYETRYGLQDDGLVGLVNLMSNLVKYDPTFKFSHNALQFIEQIFEFLFDMPSPSSRQKPKCKSATSRAAAYDLLVELCKNCPKNYTFLHAKLLAQHTPGPKPPYPWDYWPRDEGRSECGYVGLTNLGATCYMASCIQHLYMMPQARSAILKIPPTKSQKHGPTLLELQRMFAYLLESERKAYNPRSFCRVYQMDHQPLNTGEQKDMAEFFIDLVSKLEEMTPELKDLVKRLFCGTLSNNVVSLDCDHVSRTAEEFYTVRCQVADMRNLQESLDEVTVKDTLEGDNMYTCSQCGKKVRAEKRACFKRLPQILCFNTMRYTFNMVTMLKEKVNTHFSFPMRLNMSDYVEKSLMPHQYKEDREKRRLEREKAKESGDKAEYADLADEDLEECLEYELVGVTVHTGTADGGHYYSFIKERNKSVLQHDRWFLFNDAEVKPFDPSQIAAECFGGEMTSKTYDSVTEKYLDFSFEKTNSAYMLFYERRLPDYLKERHSELLSSPYVANKSKTQNHVKAEKESTKIDVDLDDLSLKILTSNCHKGNKANNDNEIPTTSSGSPSLSLSSGASGGSNKELKIDHLLRPQLNKELEEWIWQDNRQFLQDRNIFEHTYFNFMWQICGHIPQTLIAQQDVTCIAAKLSVSFFIETFIHAKEKPTMVPWVELLTKQFNASPEACEWFLSHMSLEPWWPVQVLIQCPNQMVRQMFQRLVIHVIQRLRSTHAHLYLESETDEDGKEIIGHTSCVTRFISSLILLMEHGAKAHLRHLSEFFGLLFEFSRMGDEETLFLLRIGVIKSVADFYLGNKTQDCLDVGSDNDDNSSDEALSVDKNRPASLDKMIALVASLVERSRGQDLRLKLSTKDYNAIAAGKGFPFLYQQIKDNINPHQTKHLIHALCRWDERLANQIITMLFASVTKHTELCGPFFKLLTLLTETQSGVSGLPCFSQLVLQRVWDAAEYCPQSALDWLAFQAPKNKIAHAWILQSADNWVEQYLLAHNNARVRNAAAYLLVSLVPSQSFRANFRTHSLHKLSSTSSHTYRELSNDAQIILHNIINLLLRLLRPARTYADISAHGTTKLTSYFSLLGYCMVSKTEKLMMGPYMRSLWDLFHPRLSEPSVPAHHNKHALLAFWHHTIVDCPENALIVANSSEITRNIAFNYILADHDDSEIVAYNRAMLPAYYGLLRLCCEQSRSLTRQLAAHQNLQWAFKNITPHPTQYAAAVDELFKLMTLFATRYPDASDQDKHEITAFRRTTLSAYLTALDARVSWGTLINALRILVDNDEDRLLVIYNGGIEMCFEALHTLHSMHHEATACHVAGDLQELLIASAPAVNAIGPLGPYFPRRGGKTTWPTIAKNMPRPPRPMVQMSIPHTELLHKGADLEYDAQIEAFYKPYHDFLDVMMRMAVNTNQLNDTLVKLSCLVAIEAAPLHFNLFPKFWVGIYNNKSTNKYADLLINNQYLVEYIHIILRNCRVSLSDQYIRAFLEIYYPKISSHLPIARLLYTISYSMHSKEDLDDLCGDLFAIRVIAQSTGIPTSVRKQLRGSLKALLHKSARYQEIVEHEIFANKKSKLDSNEFKETTTVASPKDDFNTPQTQKVAEVKPEVNDQLKKIADNEKSLETISETSKEQSENSTENRTQVKDNTKEEAGEAKKDCKRYKLGISRKEEEQENHELVQKETEVDKKKTNNLKEPKPNENTNDDKSNGKDEKLSSMPTTSATSSAITMPTIATSINPKNSNKKTAEDRLLAEHEKRIKLLLTMETYIKSILALMQKDENISPSAAQPIEESTMESEQNTTPVPESSDESGGNAFNANCPTAPGAAAVGAVTIISPKDSALAAEKNVSCSESSNKKLSLTVNNDDINLASTSTANNSPQI